MSELRKQFERLMEFAKKSNFQQPFSQVYFAESNHVCRFSEKPDELSRKNLFIFEDYENQFAKILKQGHSWINLNFAGMLNDALLVLIELPNYENNVDITTVNLSLSGKTVIENDWNISSFLKIID